MKKHIVKIMMLLAVPALAVVSCDSYDRTEVVPTITVDYNKITLFEGETMQLKASPATLSFTWSSSNEDIVTVDNTGLVTAKKEGAANVVAAAGDITFAVECIVQEKVAITGVTFRDSDFYLLNPGNTANVVITQIPSGGNDIPMTDFEWWSEDETVARVSDAGVIKAIDFGETKVNYRRGPYTITAKVLVPDAPNQGTLPVLQKGKMVEKRFSEYDNGGEGAGFHDVTANQNSPYIEGGGANIGYTATGEWLAYTIYVKDAGTYEFITYGSSSAGKGTWGGDYQWYLDEPNVAGNELGARFQMQSGGAWGGPWMPSEAVQFELGEGFQCIYFYMHNGAHNVAHFTAEYVGE
jgi:hypothetical protein